MAALFPADTYLFRQYVKYVQKNYKELKAYFTKDLVLKLKK